MATLTPLRARYREVLFAQASFAVANGAGTGDDNAYSRWADSRFGDESSCPTPADAALWSQLDANEAERVALGASVDAEDSAPAKVWVRDPRLDLIYVAPDLVWRNGKNGSEIAAIGSQFCGATISLFDGTKGIVEAVRWVEFGEGASEHRRYVATLKECQASGEWVRVYGEATFGSQVRLRVAVALYNEGLISAFELPNYDTRLVTVDWRAGQVVRKASAKRLTDPYIVSQCVSRPGGGGFAVATEEHQTLVSARQAARTWVQAQRDPSQFAVIRQAGETVHNGVVRYREDAKPKRTPGQWRELRRRRY